MASNSVPSNYPVLIQEKSSSMLPFHSGVLYERLFNCASERVKEMQNRSQLGQNFSQVTWYLLSQRRGGNQCYKWDEWPWLSMMRCWPSKHILSELALLIKCFLCLYTCFGAIVFVGALSSDVAFTMTTTVGRLRVSPHLAFRACFVCCFPS